MPDELQKDMCQVLPRIPYMQMHQERSGSILFGSEASNENNEMVRCCERDSAMSVPTDRGDVYYRCFQKAVKIGASAKSMKVAERLYQFVMQMAIERSSRSCETCQSIPLIGSVEKDDRAVSISFKLCMCYVDTINFMGDILTEALNETEFYAMGEN